MVLVGWWEGEVSDIAGWSYALYAVGAERQTQAGQEPAGKGLAMKPMNRYRRPGPQARHTAATRLVLPEDRGSTAPCHTSSHSSESSHPDRGNRANSAPRSLLSNDPCSASRWPGSPRTPRAATPSRTNRSLALFIHKLSDALGAPLTIDHCSPPRTQAKCCKARRPALGTVPVVSKFRKGRARQATRLPSNGSIVLPPKATPPV